MKKLFLSILVLGLLLSGNAYAECIKGDCKNGYGTMTYLDGEKYVGEFKNDIRNGRGTYTYSDGDKYVGEFKRGYRHGQGTFTWHNGDKYVGGYKRNAKHGKGVATEANGTITTGIWKRGDIRKVISQDTSVKDKSDKENEIATMKVEKKIEIASMIDKAKDTCKSLGFEEGTEKFADCSLKLYSQSVELAAEQNKTVVMQPQSSGSNVMTIYDPVRDNNALIKRGQRMLSGACTLGIDC